MFKCSHCGKVFEEVGTYKDGHDTWCCCPECGFDGYEEAVKCEVCGEWFTEDELFFDVCEDCKIKLVEEYRYKPIECYKLAGEEKETVEINSLLVSLFTPEQIESALLKVLEDAEKFFNIDCTNFIKSDIAWFIESTKGVK
jgi:hypothetical protein